MVSWNDGETSSDPVPPLPHEVVHEPYVSLDLTGKHLCKHGNAPKRLVVFDWLNNGRIFYGCTKKDGNNCGVVDWVDNEWPCSLKNSLANVWLDAAGISVPLPVFCTESSHWPPVILLSFAAAVITACCHGEREGGTRSRGERKGELVREHDLVRSNQFKRAAFDDRYERAVCPRPRGLMNGPTPSDFLSKRGQATIWCFRLRYY
ncbi:hypothetical protein ZWY2020_023130 [Hordeum vulgare]|nr:hypothetical protein ZWY2020_023130 [Hordeum vulgare]